MSARIAEVVTDPRFWRGSWEHYAHMGLCPHHDGTHTCRQFEIGLRIEEGRVRWLRADTPELAFERAATVLFDGVPMVDVEGYMG